MEDSIILCNGHGLAISGKQHQKSYPRDPKTLADPIRVASHYSVPITYAIPGREHVLKPCFGELQFTSPNLGRPQTPDPAKQGNQHGETEQKPK